MKVIVKFFGMDYEQFLRVTNAAGPDGTTNPMVGRDAGINTVRLLDPKRPTGNGGTEEWGIDIGLTCKTELLLDPDAPALTLRVNPSEDALVTGEVLLAFFNAIGLFPRTESTLVKVLHNQLYGLLDEDLTPEQRSARMPVITSLALALASEVTNKDELLGVIQKWRIAADCKNMKLERQDVALYISSLRENVLRAYKDSHSW